MYSSNFSHENNREFTTPNINPNVNLHIKTCIVLAGVHKTKPIWQIRTWLSINRCGVRYTILSTKVAARFVRASEFGHCLHTPHTQDACECIASKDVATWKVLTWWRLKQHSCVTKCLTYGCFTLTPCVNNNYGRNYRFVHVESLPLVVTTRRTQKSLQTSPRYVTNDVTVWMFAHVIIRPSLTHTKHWQAHVPHKLRITCAHTVATVVCRKTQHVFVKSRQSNAIQCLFRFRFDGVWHSYACAWWKKHNTYTLQTHHTKSPLTWFHRLIRTTIVQVVQTTRIFA